jgi:hypothetical protein
MADNWRKLRAGDRVRLLRVPEADLRQRKEEVRRGAEMAGWTADTLERILALDPVVTIDHVDEYGAPWFNYELIGEDGQPEHHSLTITEDESWELVHA